MKSFNTFYFFLFLKLAFTKAKTMTKNRKFLAGAVQFPAFKKDEKKLGCRNLSFFNLIEGKKQVVRSHSFNLLFLN